MLDLLARFHRSTAFLKRAAANGRITRWAFGLLWALVPLSALAVGSIPVSITVVLAVAAGVLAAMTSIGQTSRRGPPLLPFVLLAVLAAYTLLQAVPLPMGALAKLDPAAADIWSRALAPVHGAVTWGSLSLDPSATFVEAAKWGAYACTFYAAASLARSYGLRQCLQIVVVATVAVALVTILHQLLDMKRVFGLYLPRTNFPGRIGPLLNSNHLAGYLNLGALCAIGLALSSRTNTQRWLFATTAIIDVGASLRTASRGGAAALLVGLLMLGILVAIPSTRSQEVADRGRRIAGLTMILATAAVGVGLAALGFDRALWLELANADTGKLRMATWFRPMVADFFPLGIGRGAFESTFEAYRPALSGNTVFTHPENFIAQWISEWGLLGAAGLVAFLWIFRPWRLGLLRSPKSAGALTGLVALLLHNLVDFSLEVPGVAIAFSVVLGALWGNVRTRRQSAARDSREMGAPLVIAAFTALVAIPAGLRGSPSLPFARDEVHRAVLAAQQGKLSIESARSMIIENMRRFPAEFYFPQAGADLAFRAGEDPIPWIQRALERGPSIGLTHLILAEYLATRGARSQAFLELRLAAQYESSLATPVASTALAWGRDFDDLMRAVPEGADGIPVLDSMASRIKNPIVGGHLDEELLARDPSHRAARSRTLDRLLVSMANDDCDDWAQCEEAGNASAEALIKYYPLSSVGDQYLARLAILDEDRGRARTILRDGCTKPQDLSECAKLQATVEEPDQIPHVLERYVGANCRTNEACAEAFGWVAKFQSDRGAWGQAYGAAEKAARKSPNEARWTLAADMAEKAGLHVEAIQALEQVLKYRGLDPALTKRIDANRALAH